MYTVSGWIQTDGTDEGAIKFDAGDGTITTVGTSASATYTRVTRTFRAKGTSGVLYLRAVNNTDIVWFDDVAIVELDASLAQ